RRAEVEAVDRALGLQLHRYERGLFLLAPETAGLEWVLHPGPAREGRLLVGEDEPLEKIRPRPLGVGVGKPGREGDLLGDGLVGLLVPSGEARDRALAARRSALLRGKRRGQQAESEQGGRSEHSGLSSLSW